MESYHLRRPDESYSSWIRRIERESWDAVLAKIAARDAAAAEKKENA